MNAVIATDHLNTNPADCAECPICGRPVAECSSCSDNLEETLALSGMLDELAETLSHKAPSSCIATTAALCTAYYPIAQRKWDMRRRFTLTGITRIAASVIVLLALSALFLLATERQAPHHDIMFANATAQEMALGIERVYGTKVLLSPAANKDTWLKRASIDLHRADGEHALRAVALAFNLECERWDTTFVLRDRELALMEHGKVRHIKMDLALGHEPHEIAQLDTLGNHLLAVDGPKFSAQVAQAVKVPLPYDLSTDVKLMTRKDETYAISRTFPWFVVTPDMKLEFMALTDEDVERFEAIRAALRGEEFKAPLSAASLGPLLKTAPALAATTIGEAIRELCDKLNIDLVLGAGAELNLPVPLDLAAAATVGDALHTMCSGRPFYFTWHEKAKMLIVNERADLQQYLQIMACNMQKGMDAAAMQFALFSQFPGCFPPESARNGNSLVQLSDKALIRNHVWPLYLLSNSPLLGN